MVDDPAPHADADQQEQLDRLLELLSTGTGRLLGETISVTDEDWRAPSRLPGWSRGHVATHIARQADGLVRLTEWARSGTRTDMYGSPGQREDEIEAGALRSGLDLQVDLDTSAQQLEEAFAAVQEAGAWDALVELRGGLQVPARLLPLARLLEVTLHHVDLDLGYGVPDIDAPTADWLLEWCGFRLRQRDDFPRLELVSPTTRITVGSSGAGRTVHGSSPDLLAWLTGRGDGAPLDGTGGLRLPAF
ncbi:MAG: maleylpyruvate isomerase family mycothiol-dependent enzyme [Friedmanniella sp.]